MVRVAQLSDLHLVEPDHAARRGVKSWRLAYLSAHRRLDAADRVLRARQALEAARAADVDHVVVTGDITEDGTPAQFELFAALLHDSGIAPSRFTLVPGNHDVVDHPDAWERALEGPLRAFRPTSRPGEDMIVGDLALVPVNTTFYQFWLFSAGRMAPSQAEQVGAAVARHRSKGRAVALVQHHPVTVHPSHFLQWVDRMHDPRRERTLLDAEEHVHVLHGHIHRRDDQVMAALRRPQVFSAEAVVISDDPVRLYAAEGGALRAA